MTAEAPSTDGWKLIYAAPLWARLGRFAIPLVITASAAVLFITWPWDWLFNLFFLAVVVWAWAEPFRRVHTVELSADEVVFRGVGMTRRTPIARIKWVQPGLWIRPPTISYEGGKVVLDPSVKGHRDLVERILAANPAIRRKGTFER